MRDFKIVILECPYDTWNEPGTREFFHKMAALKMQGYQKEYKYGILPLNGSDFISDHILVCVEERGELNPVLAYRTVTENRCSIHRMRFPIVDTFREVGKFEHEKATQEIIDRCKKSNLKLSYASSLTVRPDYRGDKEVQALFKLIHLKYHQDYGVRELLSGGALRFKMDRLYLWWGYEWLKLGNKVLDPIKVGFAFDEPTGFFHLKEWSKESLAFAHDLRSFWENRITIAVSEKEKKAA